MLRKGYNSVTKRLKFDQSEGFRQERAFIVNCKIPYNSPSPGGGSEAI